MATVVAASLNIVCLPVVECVDFFKVRDDYVCNPLTDFNRAGPVQDYYKDMPVYSPQAQDQGLVRDKATSGDDEGILYIRFESSQNLIRTDPTTIVQTTFINAGDVFHPDHHREVFDPNQHTRVVCDDVTAQNVDGGAQQGGAFILNTKRDAVIVNPNVPAGHCLEAHRGQVVSSIIPNGRAKQDVTNNIAGEITANLAGSNTFLIIPDPNSRRVVAAILAGGAVIDFAAHAKYKSVEQLCGDQTRHELPNDLQYNDGAPLSASLKVADGKQCAGATFIVADTKTKMVEVGAGQDDNGSTEVERHFDADKPTKLYDTAEELRWHLIVEAQNTELVVYATALYDKMQGLLENAPKFKKARISMITKAFRNSVERSLKLKHREKFKVLKNLKESYQAELKLLTAENTAQEDGSFGSRGTGSYYEVVDHRLSPGGIIETEHSFEQRMNANTAMVKNLKKQMTTLEKLRWTLRKPMSIAGPWSCLRRAWTGQKLLSKSESMTIEQVFSDQLPERQTMHTDSNTRQLKDAREEFIALISQNLKNEMLIHKKSFKQLQKSLEPHIQMDLDRNTALTSSTALETKWNKMNKMSWGNTRGGHLFVIVAILGIAVGCIGVFTPVGWGLAVVYALLCIMPQLGYGSFKAWFKAKKDKITFREAMGQQLDPDFTGEGKPASLLTEGYNAHAAVVAN